MTNSSQAMNKPLVGILAIGCLVGAAAVWIFTPEKQAVYAGLMRVGLVMAALWFALPAPGQEMRWAKLTPALALLVVLIVVTKKTILVVLPFILVAGFVLLMLRPRAKPGAGNRRAP